VFTDSDCFCLYMAKNILSYSTLGVLKCFSMQHYHRAICQDHDGIRLMVLLGKLYEINAFSYPECNIIVGLLSITPDLVLTAQTGHGRQAAYEPQQKSGPGGTERNWSWTTFVTHRFAFAAVLRLHSLCISAGMVHRLCSLNKATFSARWASKILPRTPPLIPVSLANL
jgi:hypothetical protein